MQYSHVTRLEMVPLKYYPRWRRRTRESVCPATWKFSRPRRRGARRSPARPADGRTSQRDSTVIRKAARPRSKTSLRRRSRRSYRCRNPSRSRWRWIFAVTGIGTDRRRLSLYARSNRSRAAVLKIHSKRVDRRPHRPNVSPRPSHATYAVGISAPPVFLYTSLNAWRYLRIYDYNNRY